MKRGSIWLWLLTKRLYKRPVFLLLLLLIPLLTLGYAGMAGESSGVVTVALAAYEEDPYTLQVMEQLEQGSALIRFARCESPAAAENMVRWGKADSAWIFPAELMARVEAFAQEPGGQNNLVEVVQREETVTLRLAREKLSGVLFGLCAETKYLQYARKHGLTDLTQEALLEYYEAAAPEGALFDFSQTDSALPVTYLTAPVRGLLAVVMAVCALAAAMYQLRDDAQGTFGWISQRKKPLAELSCQLITMGNMAVAVLVALVLAGLFADPLRELVSLGLYALCCAAFAMVLRRLCGNEKALGVLLPVLAVAMTGVCPVFFDLGMLRRVQLLLPPTYYIHGLYNSGYLWYMAGYILLCGGAYLLLGKLRRR